MGSREAEFFIIQANDAHQKTIDANNDIHLWNAGKAIDMCNLHIEHAISDGFYSCVVREELFRHEYVRDIISRKFKEYGYDVRWYSIPKESWEYGLDEQRYICKIAWHTICITEEK